MSVSREIAEAQFTISIFNPEARLGHLSPPPAYLLLANLRLYVAHMDAQTSANFHSSHNLLALYTS